MSDAITDFVFESNRIEGIFRPPTTEEVSATEGFLALPEVRPVDVCALVGVYQPGAVLRDRVGLDVRVGKYYPPEGGPHIANWLVQFLTSLPTLHPWNAHREYEGMHPFTDGNGRSGRAVWAWQMIRRREGLSLGFLHRFYYQTLELSGRPA